MITVTVFGLAAIAYQTSFAAENISHNMCTDIYYY